MNLQSSILEQVNYRISQEEISSRLYYAMSIFDSGDLITFTLAQKYCKEQIEEMDKANYWVDRLNLFGNSPVAMRMLDEEMGKAV